MIEPAGSIDNFPWMTVSESGWRGQTPVGVNRQRTLSFVSVITNCYMIGVSQKDLYVSSEKVLQLAQTVFFVESVQLLLI